MVYRFNATVHDPNRVHKELQGLVWGRTMGQAASNVEKEFAEDVYLVGVKLEAWDGTTNGVLLLNKEILDEVEGDCC